ncbi:MAG: type II toxin-antitoxin system VapC family toxin [Desulfobacterota bacterium]|jgi:predicted nucleic acid-binding protein|nr:type II toxin-antitoxin system VapC family toxin [Thermodesulfobacteriota bacterium]
MSAFVLDTSVAVAWYLDEVFSPSARIWQERMLNGKDRLIVPSLHYWEFANVLRTLVWRRELAEDLAREILDLHLEAPLETGEPDRKTVLATALEYGATAYDAVFISLCLSMEVPLITAEKTTTSWVVKLKERIEAVR